MKVFTILKTCTYNKSLIHYILLETAEYDNCFRATTTSYRKEYGDFNGHSEQKFYRVAGWANVNHLLTEVTSARAANAVHLHHKN